MYLPDLLTLSDGERITSAAQWPARRQELLNLLEQEEYGYWPDFSGTASGSICDVVAPCCAGHARHEKLSISFDTPGGRFSFPMQFIFPADDRPHPLILLLNFRPGPYDPYCPVEEIIDHGFALGYLCYTDITTDDADFTQGLAACYPRQHPATDWGKLSMWAFAASRALDYLLRRPEVDARNAAVLGHSRLGKAALLCGAHDERVRFVLSNCAGCGGDALEQVKHPGAETYAFMAQTFPYWFCGNRSKYVDPAAPRPYDQHMLVAAIAPRCVSIISGSLDTWADPYAQQLCAEAASPAWELHGLPGWIGPTDPAAVGSAYQEGCIGYCLRDGLHFLSRQDWRHHMAFIQRHLDAPGKGCDHL